MRLSGVLRLGLMAALLALAACSTASVPTEGGEVISHPAEAPVPVDPAEAARIISSVRAENGLGPVTVSAQLNAIAQNYANVLAAKGAVAHDLDGRLQDRLSRAGYTVLIAGENIGGGYRSIGEAFDHWEHSPPHLANLLLPPYTKIGIATSFNMSSPYRTFWVLILALPG